MPPENSKNLEAKIPIFTIGYGTRNVENFYKLLENHLIAYLIDIRSSPYSKYNKDFSREFLSDWLKPRGITYIFMGDNLGGRPEDGECYTDGKVDYKKIQEKTFYQNGISRIISAWDKNISVALMCSEIKPEECHRSKLIGATLLEKNIEVQHIDEYGNIISQIDVIKRITGGQNELFGPPPETQRSRKKYNPPTKESD